MDHLLARVAKSAMHDTSSRPNDHTSECHPNTRQLLLKQLLESDMFLKHLIQWFWGPAGAGKTAIMRSFAKKLVEKGNFLAGFYFWRSDNARNSLKAFFPTLAQQLAENDPTTAPFIEKALLEDKRLLDKSYATQMEKLIVKPLLAAHEDHADRPHPRFIIIDGLDECDSEGQCQFLETLLPTLASNLARLPITIFVSSRPESAIDNGFSHPRLMGLTNRTCLQPSKKDVRQFLKDEFDEINRCHKGLTTEEGGKWPRESDLGILEDKSSGYFILVVTAMRHIKPSGSSRGRAPVQRLREVLKVLRKDALAPLDALYLFILRQNAPEDPIELAEWKETVGLICIPVKSEFSTWTGALGDDAFHVLYGKSRTEVEQIARDLGSIFYVDSNGQPHNYHASFPDCLFNAKRSAEFAINPQLLHERIACAIIGSLNWVHISDEDGTLPSSYDSPNPKAQYYHFILKDGLLPHVELSPTIVAGGRLETAIADLHFSQLLLLSQEGWSTFALAAVMWKGLLDLFDHPAFDPLSHCQTPVTLRLRAFFHQFLDGLQFEESFDYVSVLQLLREFFDAKPEPFGFEMFYCNWLPAPFSPSILGYDSSTTGSIGVQEAKHQATADLGVYMFKLASRFFNDDLVNRNPSFFPQVMPKPTWFLFECEHRLAFLILYSAPDQAILARLWDWCDKGLDQTRLGVGELLKQYFEDSGREYIRVNMLITYLKYFNLCRQAGMQPEGLTVDLEATWLHLSGLFLVPPDHITVLNSFPEPHPKSRAAKWLAKNPFLSKYLPTFGKPKSTPSPILSPSPADTATSLNDSLSVPETQPLSICYSDGAANLVKKYPSTVSTGSLLISGEAASETAMPADADGAKTMTDCELVDASDDTDKLMEWLDRVRDHHLQSQSYASTTSPLAKDVSPEGAVPSSTDSRASSPHRYD